MFCFTVTISIILILSFYLPSIFLEFINIIVLYDKLQMGEIINQLCTKFTSSKISFSNSEIPAKDWMF